MSKLPEMERRRIALEKTKARHKGKPFAWGNDCIGMFRGHLVAMGHKKLPKIPRYSTALGARRALAEVGFETIEGLIDSLLPRITPASMWLGDIATVQGSDGFDAVVICMGHKFLGFQEDAEGAEVLIVREIKAAWRA